MGVVGKTPVLTNNGYSPIENWVAVDGKTFWNGSVWVPGTVIARKSSGNTLRVKTSLGENLIVSDDHKFHLKQSGYKYSPLIIRADCLKPGDTLYPYTLPIFTTGKPVDMDVAFYAGYKLGRALRPTTELTEPVIRIPWTWDLRAKARWLAGLAESAGHFSTFGHFQFRTPHREFITELRLFLSTLGVYARVRPIRLAVDVHYKDLFESPVSGIFQGSKRFSQLMEVIDPPDDLYGINIVSVEESRVQYQYHYSVSGEDNQSATYFGLVTGV